MMSLASKLEGIRERAGERLTPGLPMEVVAQFENDETLSLAVDAAIDARKCLTVEEIALIAGPEADALNALQVDFANFYAAATRTPYIPLGACGPWVVSAHGAVIYETAGYGMLGLGHAPEKILDAMKPAYAMANIMTPSFLQKRFTTLLKKELGNTRPDGKCPFERFICMNSGSEAVSVACRISDVNAKSLVGNAETTPKYVSLSGSFHGRTFRAAQLSNSCKEDYRDKLASFASDVEGKTLTVEQDDPGALEALFEKVYADGGVIEAVFMEPVQGEGNPGRALSPAMYATARRLTREKGTLLVVDSIQAGMRAQGSLSIVDYPGFRELDPPDIEVYSKALNAGQYPLSIIALAGRAAEAFTAGIYGNTMTGNPRALAAGCAVLESMTPLLKKNIVDRGVELKEKFLALKAEFEQDVPIVEGTGLLVSFGLNKERLDVVGDEAIEQFMRRNGINVIHGGVNRLRFTPWFAMTSQEVDLLVNAVRHALTEGPRK